MDISFVLILIFGSGDLPYKVYRDRSEFIQNICVMHYVGDVNFFTFAYLGKITVHCRTQISHLVLDELQ